MNPIEERYLELAEKWLNGTITPEEEQEYARWYNSQDSRDVLEVPVDWAADREAHRVKILQQINRRRKPVVRLKKKKYWAAAAAIFIFIAGSYWWIQRPSLSSQTTSQSRVKRKISDVSAGTTGAILTLSNGRTIVLDTARNGSLTSMIGADVFKTESSVTFLTHNSKNSYAIEYNALVTPRGRQQQLVLSDGTKVWLNAESSIKFPTAFKDMKREVTITGEAYFEVAKNPLRPFIVHINNALIEVLGTHFNVMAYNNEPALETTLLEGSVKFRNESKVLLLKPGQQSRLLANKDLQLINDADVDMAVAWKNGMQAFNKTDLRTIMRQVERWYDVDVEFAGNVTKRTFSGEIPRSANLSALLKLFEATDIHFSVDPGKKKLTVMP